MGWSSQSCATSGAGVASAGRSATLARSSWTLHDRGGLDLLRDAQSVCRFEPAAARSADTDLLDGFIGRLLDPAGSRAGFAGWAEAAVPNLLAILAPAAQRLGVMWIEDECSFCDVTLGMHRLALLLIDLEARAERPAPQHGGSVLIAPAPDDQHGFGTALVGFFLRRAGWDVTADISGCAERIALAIQRTPYTVAGFSVGHERAIAPVAALIRKVRARSRNPRIRLALGGPMIVGNAALARDMGADLWADDAESLVRQLSDLTPAAV